MTSNLHLDRKTKPGKYQIGFVQSVAAKVLTAYLRHMTKTQLVLKKAKISTLPGPQKGHKYVLYAHVPFCEILCPYCSFNRFTYKDDRAKTYFHDLREEMRMVAKLGYHFESMYIGGGTPTIEIDELCKTIDLAKELFEIGEVSCETNPNHLTPEIMDKLQGRVDRLSVGVQSFDDDLLKQMSRYHKFGSGDEIIERIKSVAGRLPSLNVDMIFNFPNQTEEMLRSDIEKIIGCGANQVTFYPLMSSSSVETAMSKSIGLVNYRREGSYYQLIADKLSKAFVPMSAWTFSRKGEGMIDEYIVEYEEYVGVGSGSFSYLDGTLYVNTFSLSEYDRAITSGRMSVTEMRSFGRLERMQYRFMMQLFDLQLNKKQFQDDFGLPIELGLWKEMFFMWLAGAFNGSYQDLLKLDAKNRYLMVVMMREFFAGVNNIRDQARMSLAPNERLMCLVNEKVMA